MSTATSRSERSRAISSPMALVVAATKRRETADLDIDFERASSSSPIGLGHVDVAPGGHPGQHALDDERVEQVGRAERLPGIEPDLGARRCCGPAGARCSTWRPPSTTEPVVVPCQFPTRSCGADPGVLGADLLGQLGRHHLVHDDEPGGRGERQQPVLDRPGHLGQGHCRLQRQVSQSGCLLRVGDAHNSYLLLHRWSPSWLGCLGGRPIPYQLAGLRRGTTALLQQCSGVHPVIERGDVDVDMI